MVVQHKQAVEKVVFFFKPVHRLTRAKYYPQAYLGQTRPARQEQAGWDEISWDFGCKMDKKLLLTQSDSQRVSEVAKDDLSEG